MPNKSFTVGGSNDDPVTFDLNGTDRRGQPIAPIRFHCVSSRVSPWFLALLATTLVGGFLAASATSRPVLTTGIVLLVLAGWAVSLCLHEFGHAYTAYMASPCPKSSSRPSCEDVARAIDDVL